MIICRTPFRISFFGGGTDYPAWYRAHGGAVLGATIDKYCWLTCRYLPPFFEHKIRVVYRRIETCKSADEIEHPVVRAVLRCLNFERGLELHHDGDLPARSGMGSSSAFTVGLLHALHALRGHQRSKLQLAHEAIQVEQDLLGETVGSQDQVLAAFGGLKYVLFHPDGRIAVDPLPLPPARVQELHEHLMLFYTGVARTAADVAQSYAGDLAARRRQLEALREMVEAGIDILLSGMDLREFGLLLHEAWQTKRTLSDQITNPQLDALYDRACRAGAIGGKLTGAGGGGFLLLFVPPRKRGAVLDALHDVLHVPFAFDNAGSQIVFNEPGVDYQEAERARRRRPALAFRELSTAV
jgi:D-glycero-alpha-D-manno-heptose-7-phosphate kinase